MRRPGLPPSPSCPGLPVRAIAKRGLNFSLPQPVTGRSLFTAAIPPAADSIVASTVAWAHEVGLRIAPSRASAIRTVPERAGTAARRLGRGGLLALARPLRGRH